MRSMRLFLVGGLLVGMWGTALGSPQWNRVWPALMGNVLAPVGGEKSAQELRKEIQKKLEPAKENPEETKKLLKQKLEELNQKREALNEELQRLGGRLLKAVQKGNKETIGQIRQQDTALQGALQGIGRQILGLEGELFQTGLQTPDPVVQEEEKKVEAALEGVGMPVNVGGIRVRPALQEETPVEDGKVLEADLQNGDETQKTETSQETPPATPVVGTPLPVGPRGMPATRTVGEVEAELEQTKERLKGAVELLKKADEELQTIKAEAARKKGFDPVKTLGILMSKLKIQQLAGAFPMKTKGMSYQISWAETPKRECFYFQAVALGGGPLAPWMGEYCQDKEPEKKEPEKAVEESPAPVFPPETQAKNEILVPVITVK